MARNLSDSISMSDRRPQPTDRKENRNCKEKPSGYYCSSKEHLDILCHRKFHLFQEFV
jgi:hypothetical protein